MPLYLSRLLTGATLLGAGAALPGCDRPSPRAEKTSEAAAPADSGSKPAASLPQQIADVVVQLNGGIHTGFRFMHAKGIVTSGTFTPTAEAKTLSRAAHFNGPPVPVTVRFSNAPGVPTNADNSPGSGPRGIAIRFNLPGGAFTDIVSISHNGFVVGTGEDFLAFLKAAAASGPDAPSAETDRDLPGQPPPSRQVPDGGPGAAQELRHAGLLREQRLRLRGRQRQEAGDALPDRSGGRRGDSGLRLARPRRERTI